ncbi:hypothetical protein trd_A0401 (plasmid) [Thermomicrobium roseum DSM 5159]|uniref:Uncharacterized protein n=1 Tax=Thermomicrobium roseum (strain ATCC 27502 / DSM 5159 / P-2) TaxID=309801 RepID=B9L3N7_THERP|nr:hypothetical protein trd_A0401 [Thermomicrobium roseum DSM 5159]
MVVLSMGSTVLAIGSVGCCCMTVVRACRGTTAPFDAVAGPLQEG